LHLRCRDIRDRRDEALKQRAAVPVHSSNTHPHSSFSASALRYASSARSAGSGRNRSADKHRERFILVATGLFHFGRRIRHLPTEYPDPKQGSDKKTNHDFWV
jgi:hypothetical protein